MPFVSEPWISCVCQHRDLCVFTVPSVSAECPLLQSFLRVPPRASSSLVHELYVFHRAGLRWVVLLTLLFVLNKPVTVSALVLSFRLCSCRPHSFACCYIWTFLGRPPDALWLPLVSIWPSPPTHTPVPGFQPGFKPPCFTCSVRLLHVSSWGILFLISSLAASVHLLSSTVTEGLLWWEFVMGRTVQPIFLNIFCSDGWFMRAPADPQQSSLSPSALNCSTNTKYNEIKAGTKLRMQLSVSTCSWSTWISRSATFKLTLVMYMHRVSRPLFLSVNAVVVLRPVGVRPAVSADRPAVSALVRGLALSESLLKDLDCFYESRGDPVSPHAQLSPVSHQEPSAENVSGLIFKRFSL